MHENRGEPVKNNNNNGSLYRFAHDYKDLFLDYMDPMKALKDLATGLINPSAHMHDL